MEQNDSTRVMELLDKKRNVIIMGAPGTGKSRLINEIAVQFEKKDSALEVPSHAIGANIPIPATIKSGLDVSFLQKKNRRVFRTTLHQNSKYRDFLTGIIPSVENKGQFEISKGILYRANEYAKQDDSAALLIIDELNRGPAIEVFGGSIVAIEYDKRLGDDNKKNNTTQTFEILNPENGLMMEYAFSPNLYLLAAMNQADVSVAPLDVAFLRRWQPFRLLPDYSALEEKYSIDLSTTPPEEASSSEDVFLTACLALKRINEKIIVGRGEDYQLGQGVFLSTNPKDKTKEEALIFICEVWDMIYAHIEELFFGDSQSISYIINANNNLSPYSIVEEEFAGELRTIIKKTSITVDNVYNLYLAAGR